VNRKKRRKRKGGGEKGGKRSPTYFVLYNLPLLRGIIPSRGGKEERGGGGKGKSIIALSECICFLLIGTLLSLVPYYHGMIRWRKGRGGKGKGGRSLTFLFFNYSSSTTLLTTIWDQRKTHNIGTELKKEKGRRRGKGGEKDGLLLCSASHEALPFVPLVIYIIRNSQRGRKRKKKKKERKLL